MTILLTILFTLGLIAGVFFIEFKIGYWYAFNLSKFIGGIGFFLFFFTFIYGIVSTILGSILSNKLKNRYRDFSYNLPTGSEVALNFTSDNNLDVEIKELKEAANTKNFLIPILSKRNKLKSKICLSSEVYNSNTPSAIAVTLHECFHSLQIDKLITARKIKVLALIDGLSKSVGSCIITYGIWHNARQIVFTGIIIVCINILDNLDTLVKEGDASIKALAYIKRTNLMTNVEYNVAKRTLIIAYFTYILAALNDLFIPLVYGIFSVPTTIISTIKLLFDKDIIEKQLEKQHDKLDFIEHDEEAI